jgi:glycosyltransferase involved in cell wall biosynthesis
MTAPRVSVLIDTYNYGRFIEEAVESALAQDFPHEQMEILVVDDGSTDDTQERLKKYAGRMYYFRKENGGQASAFNFGLARARGEIVAFLDADDYWLPGKLKRVVEEFERHPEAGMVYHNLRKLDADGAMSEGGFAGVSGLLPSDRRKLLGYDLHPTSTLAFRRSVLDQLLPVPEELVIQADAQLSACAIFLAPVVYVAEPLAVYRIHGGNLWNLAGQSSAKERLQRRMKTTRAIGDDVRQWLAKNGFEVNRPEIRAFLMQWTISSRADEFALSPPGRWRFFRHLLEQPRYFGTRMTQRHKIVFYVNAFASLLVGYKNFPRLDEWRVTLKRSVRSTLGRSASDL